MDLGIDFYSTGRDLLFLIVGVTIFGGLAFLVIFWFIKKRYPQKVDQLLSAVTELEEIGLKRDEKGYSGYYRNFFITIYATTSLPNFDANYWTTGGNRYQVWVAVAPEPGQLKGLGGFFGKYLVSGETAGFAYIGFMVNADATHDAKRTIIEKIQTLIGILEEKNIRPYIVPAQ